MTVEDKSWTQPDALGSWIGIVQRENMENEALQEYGFVSQLFKVPLETQSLLLPHTQTDLAFIGMAFSGPCLKNHRQFVKLCKALYYSVCFAFFIHCLSFSHPPSQTFSFWWDSFSLHIYHWRKNMPGSFLLQDPEFQQIIICLYSVNNLDSYYFPMKVLFSISSFCRRLFWLQNETWEEMEVFLVFLKI